MGSCQRKPQKKALNFGYATRSFLGYLEGTSKSLNTIKNYEGDLKNFETFLEKALGKGHKVLLNKITRSDVEKYHDYLKIEGFKTNTRRRKILTVRRLLRYLTKRRKISLDLGDQIPAPHKVERVPVTVSYEKLLVCIQAMPTTTEIEARNRALLWVLAETGCLVSEIQTLQFEDFQKLPEPAGFQLLIGGKSPRAVPISLELFQCVEGLKKPAENKAENASSNQAWVFFGYNRFGSLGAPISPRGVELLVRHYSPRFGMPELTPRTFRHSTVLHWFKQGIARDEIQKRLGLKTPYAFRTFEPLLEGLRPIEQSSQISSQ